MLAVWMGALASGQDVPVLPDVEASPAVAADQARSWEVEPANHGRKPVLHAVLWVPRVVFFVPRVVLMGVFAPIRLGMETVDRTHLVPRVENLIYWDQAHTYGLMPSVSYGSDFGVSAGATLFHDDAFGHGEEAKLKASYGGEVVQSYEAGVLADRLGGSRVWLDLQGSYERNPRQIFAGIGPDLDAVESRFSQHRGLGLLGGGPTIGADDQVQLGVVGTINHRSFGEGLGRNDVSIETVYDTATLTGFDEGVTSVEGGAVARADLRSSRGITATGAFFEVFGGPATTTTGGSWVHYGAELSLTGDLYRGNRLLTVRAFVDAVDGGSSGHPLHRAAAARRARSPAGIPPGSVPRQAGAGRQRVLQLSGAQQRPGAPVRRCRHRGPRHRHAVRRR